MKKNTLTKISILSVLILAVLSFVFTPVAYASPAVSAKKLPRMVTVTFYGTDGTQMSFNWNTTDYTGSDVYVVEASDALGFGSSSVIKTTGEYHISKASKSDGFIHTCVVSNLKLATKYLYKVGDAELNVWSEVGSFVTSGDAGAPFTFIHVSDPQSDEEQYYDIYREVLRSATKNCSPQFIVNTGDIVNNNWKGSVPNLNQWEWALTGTFDVMKDYPIVATTGNHEAADYDFSERFNFDTPEGASTKSGVYYSFNYNGVHFTAINTNDTSDHKSPDTTGLSDEQLNWIKSDLEKNKNAKWKIVLMHKPIYDCGAGGNNTEDPAEGRTNYDIPVMRRQLAPLFTQYGVDLVVQGHDHLYSKSYPLVSYLDESGEVVSRATVTESVLKSYNGGTYDFYDDPKGTIYIDIGSPSGWKNFPPVSDYPKDLIDKAGQGTVMYTAVSIEGDNLFVHTYTLDGKFESVPYYAFGVTKTSEWEAPVDNNGKFPTWAIVLIVAGGVLVVGGSVGATLLILKSKNKKTAANTSSEDASDGSESNL